MATNKTKHQSDIKQFSKERSVFETFALVLNDILTAAVKIHAPNSIVQSRAKNVSSYAEKIIRKNKYNDPLTEITDLCGARVITHTQDQVNKICNFIRENFLIDEANSVDVKERLRIQEFGYRSVHFIVSPVKEEILGVNIPQIIRNRKAEIQVRTLLQHTWADVLHDRLYKTALKIPDEWVRESARLAALLENADENISRITSRTDSYTANFGNRMSRDMLNREIQTLSTILVNEPDRENKPIIALKIAKLARFEGNWKLIFDLLSNYKDLSSKVQNEVLLEYIFASCKLKRGGKNGLKNGIKTIKYIIEKNYNKESTSSVINAAYIYLAELLQESASPKEISLLYESAFANNPSNQYVLAKIFEYNPYYSKSLSLLVPGIKEGIKKCEEDILLGIESYAAYFTGGRLSLILKDTKKAFFFYLKALQLFLSDGPHIYKDSIINELKSLSRLIKSLPNKISAQDIISILNLGLYLKFCDNSGIISKKRAFLPVINPKHPVLILSGSCLSLNQDKKTAIESSLIESLRAFNGTIIYYYKDKETLGMINKSLTASGRKGIRNNLFLINNAQSNDAKINGNAGAIREKFIYHETTFIQIWRDILSNGIAPKDVTVVGFGGEEPSLFEYSLSLAFGAKLGIIEDSGGASSELSASFEWNSCENIHIIPNEYACIRAFLNYQVSSDLSETQISEIAKTIHINYVTKKHEAFRIEPSLKNWDELNESLKKSNLNQALNIIEILKLAGLEVKKVTGREITEFNFSPEELNLLSQLEHGRFVADRLMNGWKVGKAKNIEKKITPYLVKWEELPMEIKQYDTDAVLNFPRILKTANYEIVRKVKKNQPRIYD